ncbi:MAG: ion transporter [Lachnospiraceae bacterium]
MGKLRKLYNYGMIVVIIASLVPLCFAYDNSTLRMIDKITVTIFIADYLVRWGAKIHRDRSLKAFLSYPVQPMAIIDLLAILPSISAVNNVFKTFRVLRL